MSQYNRRNDGSNSVKSSLRPARFIFIITVIVVVVGFFGFSPFLFKGSTRDAVIYIPAGATSENVKDSLEKYCGQSFAKSTMRLLELRKVDFSKRHGRYEITKGTTPFAAMRRLGSGGQQPVDLTVNGFRSIDLLSERIAAKMEFSPQQFKNAITDPKVLATYGLKPDEALALFLDDTYEVYWTASPEEVVKKIGENYNAYWSNERRKKAEAMGITPAEAMILCSIADEETLIPEEKGRIARLYLNRLEIGMKLQADPTVRYALGDFSIRRVMEKHLNFDSPYNTYKYEGLPPGPIRTTSEATLNSFLDSAPTSDLYMCAKEDFSGSHNFANSYEIHQENAHRYQAALDARGIE